MKLAKLSSILLLLLGSVVAYAAPGMQPPASQASAGSAAEPFKNGDIVCWVGDSIIFTAFNGQPLTAGDHYLIVETRDDGLTVRQPQGPDTRLSLMTAKPVQRVQARFDQGTCEVPFRLADGQMSLEINSKLQGRDVRCYELSFGEEHRPHSDAAPAGSEETAK